MKIGLFSNSSQTIRPKGLKISWFDGGHPRDVITRFSEDQFVTPLRRLVLKGSTIHGLMGHPGDIILKFSEDQFVL